MLDDITEADWRSVALWDAPRPAAPELVPGLPGVNAERLLRWREQEIAWRLARAERLRFGLPQ